MSDLFDRMAKTVAGGVSRREALKGLGGLLAGSFLALLPGRARADDDDDDEGNEEINEACRKFCAKCPRRPRGVHGKCIVRCKATLRKGGTLCGACTATNPFPGCVSGATCCVADSTSKTPYCANLQTDVNHCGKCDTKPCTGTTPACCSGACVDLASDVNNCGACGTQCAKGQTCSKGMCG